MGGPTAGREGGRRGRGMTSVHTFLLTQYGYVLRGSVSHSISMALCRLTSKSVCGCV